MGFSFLQQIPVDELLAEERQKGQIQQIKNKKIIAKRIEDNIKRIELQKKLTSKVENAESAAKKYQKEIANSKLK